MNDYSFAAEANAIAVPTAIPTPRFRVGQTHDFWVKVFNRMGSAHKSIRAKNHWVGNSSYLFVQEPLRQAFPNSYFEKLYNRMEVATKPESFRPDLGVLPLLQKIFATLPDNIHPDRRLTLLFLDHHLKHNKHLAVDFRYADQIKVTGTGVRRTRSNEMNLLYIFVDPDNLPGVEEVSAAITKKLFSLLSFHAVGGNFHQDSWIEDIEAQAALIFAGYFTSQKYVSELTRSAWRQPLNNTIIHPGLAALFAAFMIDRLPPLGGFDYLVRLPQKGREAIERTFYVRTGRVTSFYAVYGEFISYLFRSSYTEELLPMSRSGFGYRVPQIRRMATIESLPFEMEAALYPYAFSIIEIDSNIPANTDVKLEIIKESSSNGPPASRCSDPIQLLWKPLSGAIALYSVGCKYGNRRDMFRYRVTIFRRTPHIIAY